MNRCQLSLALPTLLLFLASCASNPGPVPPEPGSQAGAATRVSNPALKLPAGAWIQLKVEIASRRKDYAAALRSWLHEALAQSPHFDFARNGTGEYQLILRGNEPGSDNGHSRLVTSLKHGEAELIPITGVDFAPGSAIAAIDRLALETRRALGEPQTTLTREARSCGLLVSTSEACAALCDRAILELQGGHRIRAASELGHALRIDDRSPLALSLMAGLRADQGRSRQANELASRVLQLSDRASPSSFSRALRIRYMQERSFEELLLVAEKSIGQRPYDADLRFSRAFALCMLGRYSDCHQELVSLRRRFPHRPGPLYCLTHAQLALGRAKRALAARADIESILPKLVSFRLIAFSLLLANQFDELATHLRLGSERFARDQTIPAELISELNEMRSAFAILRNDTQKATECLLAELDRLRSDSRLLLRRAERLPAIAWCLARMGKAEASRSFLTAMDKQEPTRQVIPYLETARAIARTWLAKGPTDRELAVVRNFGLLTWSERLAAQRATRSGRFSEAEALLRSAVTRGDSLGAALEQAELWVSLGRREQAGPLLTTLRRELYKAQMSDPRGFVLSRPEHAMVAQAAK
ncbi:MAG: hypothetical protein CSA62_12435 [Planctomycetota bacterium]|nr:MAG: hypothetical protein CSA62_12435 [Planctomycetota bacterium]